LFAAAHGGTLFLDEIGAASEALQLRLLRVVEEQLVRPVGSTRSQPVDVRIAAATNEDLMRAIGEGRFRSDLYYRLRGATVRLPPLRRRPDDIPLLAYHALDLWAQHREGAHPGIAKEAMALLVKYPWPGNVRELISEVQEAASACPDEPIRPRHLSIRALAPQPGDETGDEEGSRLRLLTETLRHTGGNVAEAGRVLGISRSTMYRWLRSVGLR